MTMNEIANDIEPVERQKFDSQQYYRFTCSKCGEKTKNSYVEPVASQMLERRLCYTCNYWVEEEKKYERDHRKMTIIGGHVYGPGSRTTGSFRGMAGRRFDIEYIEPSAFAGKRITTFDLWSGSAMPDALRAKFPDTARFLGGAEKAQVGETTCWNPTNTREDPYPLPSTLGLK